MLYELTTETYIANDTFLVGGQGMAEQSQERFEDEEEGEKIQSLVGSILTPFVMAALIFALS